MKYHFGLAVLVRRMAIYVAHAGESCIRRTWQLRARIAGVLWVFQFAGPAAALAHNRLMPPSFPSL